MKIILLIAHLIAIATGTGMSIANYINIRIAAGEKGERREALSFLRYVLGRVGGEEFAVVLPDTTLLGALDMAERMRRAVAAQVFELPLPGSDKLAQHRQTASLGVAELKPAMAGARELLAAADQRLYESKRGGRNCVSS